jgi:hypothetical protein
LIIFIARTLPLGLALAHPCTDEIAATEELHSTTKRWLFSVAVGSACLSQGNAENI